MFIPTARTESFISFCCHCKRFSHDGNGFDILKILFYYGKDSLASFKSDRSPPVVRVVCKVKSWVTSGAALWRNNCSQQLRLIRSRSFANSQLSWVLDQSSHWMAWLWCLDAPLRNVRNQGAVTVWNIIRNGRGRAIGVERAIMYKGYFIGASSRKSINCPKFSFICFSLG